MPIQSLRLATVFLVVEWVIWVSTALPVQQPLDYPSSSTLLQRSFLPPSSSSSHLNQLNSREVQSRHDLLKSQYLDYWLSFPAETSIDSTSVPSAEYPLSVSDTDRSAALSPDLSKRPSPSISMAGSLHTFPTFNSEGTNASLTDNWNQIEPVLSVQKSTWQASLKPLNMESSLSMRESIVLPRSPFQTPAPKSALSMTHGRGLGFLSQTSGYASKSSEQHKAGSNSFNLNQLTSKLKAMVKGDRSPRRFLPELQFTMQPQNESRRPDSDSIVAVSQKSHQRDSSDLPLVNNQGRRPGSESSLRDAFKNQQSSRPSWHRSSPLDVLEGFDRPIAYHLPLWMHRKKASGRSSMSSGQFSPRVSGIRLSRKERDLLRSLSPEDLNLLNIDKLPEAIFDRVATSLTPKDIARLGSASKSLHQSTSSLMDIRTLYSKNHTYAESVSPVQLYRFCIEGSVSFPAGLYLNYQDCFANVDRLVDSSTIYIYRLQFMYGIMQIQPASKNMEGVWMDVFKSFLISTDWMGDQVSIRFGNLLYFAASRSAKYYHILFEKACLTNHVMSTACYDSPLLASPSSIDLILSIPAIAKFPQFEFLNEYGSPKWHQSCQDFEVVSSKLCTINILTTEPEFIGTLLESGANIHHPCLHQMLINRYAIRDTYGSESSGAIVLEELLEWGYAINDLTRASLLLAFEDPALIKIVLDAGASVDAHYRKGFTALYYACRHDDLDKVALLLQYGADPNNGGSDRSTLMVSKSVEINRLLIDFRANVNFQNREGNTPLFAAVDHQSLSLTRLLLEHGANVFHTTPLNQTVLMLVREPELAKMLIESAPLILNARDWKGLTAVHYAVLRWCYPVLTVLIDSGADLNMPDGWGQTPLMKSDEVKASRLLLESGRVQVNRQDRYGYTALMLAVAHKRLGLVKLLLRHGALVGLKNVVGEDVFGVTARASSVSLISQHIMAVLRKEHQMKE